MKRKETKEGFRFKPDVEYIKQTMDMPAWSKLKWLEEANAFINEALSKKKRKLWEKFRRGEIYR